MPDINGLIAEISNERRDLLEEVETMAKQLTKTTSIMDSLKSLPNNNNTNTEGSSAYISQEESEDISQKQTDLKKRLADQKGIFENFQNNGGCLTLALVGPSSAGKSTLISRITGLNTNIVPAFAHGQTTSTTVVYKHNPDLADGLFKATVEFYSKDEMTAMFNDRAVKANIGIQFDDGKYQQFANAVNNARANFRAIGGSYFTFCEYVEEYPQFRNLLGQGAVTVTDENVLNRYINRHSQDKSFRAVKKITIECHYTSNSYAKINFCDTVGTSDPLFSVVQNTDKTDGVIFCVAICDPTQGLNAADQDAYVNCVTQFKDIANKRLYVAFNIHDQNFAGTDKLNGTIVESEERIKHAVTNQPDFYPAKFLKANFKDGNVIDDILMPAVNSLVTEFSASEKTQIDAYKAELNQIIEQFRLIGRRIEMSFRPKLAYEHSIGKLKKAVSTTKNIKNVAIAMKADYVKKQKRIDNSRF